MMRRKLFLIFIIFFSMTILTLQTFATNRCPFPKLPRGYLRVPILRQAYDHTCGPAALLSVLYYWGVSDEGESSLYKMLEPDEKEGVIITKLVEGAKAYNLKASFRENMTISDLRRQWKRGNTVILAMQAWPDKKSEYHPPLEYWRNLWTEGHYVVLIGMDKNFAYFMDPSTPLYYTYIALNELEARWHEEETLGKVWRYQHGGVIIRGKKPLKQTHPHRLVRLR